MSEGRRPSVVVIGSLNMDLVTRTERSPIKGETVFGRHFDMIPGGKGANQAVALAKLQADCTLIGAVGKDEFGLQLKASLEAHGVNTASVKQVAGITTGVASIVLADSDNSIIVVPGANSHCFPQDIEQKEELIRCADIVLIQMEIPLDTVCFGVELAAKHGIPVIVNPAPAQKLPDETYRRIDYLTPNLTELAVLADGDGEGKELKPMMKRMIGLGVRNVITTLGDKGSAYVDSQGEMLTIPAYPVPVTDTTGAGDAFNAGLAYSLALGKPLQDAVAFAAKVSALAVTKFGAQAGMPSLQEVQDMGKPGY